MKTPRGLTNRQKKKAASLGRSNTEHRKRLAGVRRAIRFVQSLIKAEKVRDDRSAEIHLVEYEFIISLLRTIE